MGGTALRQQLILRTNFMASALRKKFTFSVREMFGVFFQLLNELHMPLLQEENRIWMSIFSVRVLHLTDRPVG